MSSSSMTSTVTNSWADPFSLILVFLVLTGKTQNPRRQVCGQGASPRKQPVEAFHFCFHSRHPLICFFFFFSWGSFSHIICPELVACPPVLTFWLQLLASTQISAAAVPWCDSLRTKPVLRTLFLANYEVVLLFRHGERGLASFLLSPPKLQVLHGWCKVC